MELTKEEKEFCKQYHLRMFDDVVREYNQLLETKEDQRKKDMLRVVMWDMENQKRRNLQKKKDIETDIHWQEEKKQLEKQQEEEKKRDPKRFYAHENIILIN